LSKATPSHRAVDERIIAANGRSTTIALIDNPGAGFPRELRQDLCEFVAFHLRKEEGVTGARVTDDVNRRIRQHGGFATIDVFGLLPTQALEAIRRIKAWFLQSKAPRSEKRLEKRRRKHRQLVMAQSKRQNRYGGRRLCRSDRQRWRTGKVLTPVYATR